MRPLYIFDIDGTLAIIKHRVGILENKENPNRWRDFYAACDKDEPNKPVIFVMNNLMLSGADVWLFSGRSEEVRDKTLAWIAKHTAFMQFNLNFEHLLTMRPAMDFTPDDVLKKNLAR
jgi:hypothetical protein